MGQRVRQEGRYHDIVEFVLLRPQLFVTDDRVHLNEELSEGVIDLTFNHPSFDHSEDRR